MIYLAKFCCVCLAPAKKMEKISIQDNCLSYYDKLAILIPEMNIKNIKPVAFICLECKRSTDSMFSFRKTCLKRNNTLQRYLTQLCLSTDDINNIKTEMVVVKTKVEIPDDYRDESNDSMDYVVEPHFINFDNNLITEFKKEVNIEENIKKELSDDEMDHYDSDGMSESEDNEPESKISNIGFIPKKINIQDMPGPSTSVQSPMYPNITNYDISSLHTEIDVDRCMKNEISDEAVNKSSNLQENNEGAPSIEFIAPKSKFRPGPVEPNAVNPLESEYFYNHDLQDIGHQDTSMIEGKDSLLPEHSKQKYEAAYNSFIEWKNANKMESFTESSLLVYFDQLSKTYKPSSLWSIYSMLKSTLSIKHNVNVNSYDRLSAFLKGKSAGFVPKKSKVLSPEHIEEFISKATDEKYLATKMSEARSITRLGVLQEEIPFDSDSEDDHISTASEIDDVITGDDAVINESNSFRTEYVSKCGVVWNVQPSDRTRNHNIRGPMSEVTLPDKIYENPSDVFMLFFEQVIDDIVVYTNNEARAYYEMHVSSDNWKPTDAGEIRAFMGLLLTTGHLKMQSANIETLWNEMYGPAIFRATMSRNRFKLLLRFIRFDDRITRCERREADKFAPFRETWEKINDCFCKYYIPGSNLTVGEQLVPFRGRCPFRQYVASKPEKYGIKIRWVCDSETLYPLRGIPYLGKTEDDENFRVLESLVGIYKNTNRNVTCDNYFTDLTSAYNLLANELTIVGTVRKDKTFVPVQFLPSKQRAVESSLFGFTEHCTLVSYVPKKNKSVILLSTAHHTKDITEHKQKPEIVQHYDKTKRAVDSLDQLVHAYMSKRPTNPWPLVLFINTIDVAAFAAYIIWSKLHPERNSNRNNKRHLFLIELAESLLLPVIRTRSNDGLQRNILTAKRSIINTSASTSVETSGENLENGCNKKRRCFICDSSKSRMSKQKCDSCRKTVCNEHSIVKRMCRQCL